MNIDVECSTDYLCTRSYERYTTLQAFGISTNNDQATQEMDEFDLVFHDHYIMIL